MSKVLILAPSGFGKSSSIGKIPEFNQEGLNPKETFIITVTSKPLPFKGSQSQYKICDASQPPTAENGNRFITNQGAIIAKIINFVSANRPEIKNIVIDDSNYVMQDYYMANSLKKGYDVFKEIGAMMNEIFTAMELQPNMNFFMMGHYEEFKDSSLDTVSYRYKTTGKMTQDYITPEGKFEIVLFGKQTYDHETQKVSKQFVTNFDGQFPSKSPVGMFKDLYIPNDLGFVTKQISNYYN